jgi:hypothetical protein
VGFRVLFFLKKRGNREGRKGGKIEIGENKGKVGIEKKSSS